MPVLKKIVLPPRPVTKPRIVLKPDAKPTVNFADLTTIRAVDYVITLSDGTSLRAQGEHADIIFRYLSECERVCSSAQMANFLAPSFGRYSADGVLLAQGKDFDDPRNIRS